MIHWAPYLYVRLTLCFCAGILWQIYGESSYALLPLFIVLLTVVFLIFHIAGTRQASDLFIFLAGFTSLIVVFLLGSIITYQRTESNQANHLLHQKLPVDYYTGVISDFVVEKPNHYNVILRVNQVRSTAGWQSVTGKILLMMRKAPGLRKPQYGDVLLVKGRPVLPEASLNPYAFNSKEYLARQQIYHQHYVWPEQINVIGYDPPYRFMATSIQLRNYLDAILKKYVPGQRNYAIATALVLGMKEYLDTDIKAAYTRTGTTHVLAVSGLHVALLFFALNIILGRLAKTQRQKLVLFLVLLLVMWLYAFVTALSASVLRAVVMFSLLSVGKFFKRRSNMYNILAATAFALLVYNPYFLLDVGFQLSFAAVLGIVLWQPRFNSLIDMDNWLGKKLWEGVTASVAAQLATIPLALYYFHQFPVYFLVANLFAVLISEFILYVGFGLLAFSWFPGAGQLLGQVMGWLLDGMNYVVLLMEKWPMAIIESISLSMAQAWMLAGAFLLATWFMLYRHKLFLVAFAITVACYSALQLAKMQSQHRQQLWVVYNLKNTSGLGFIQGKQATLLADSAVLANKNNFTYNIQPHWYQLGIQKTHYITLPNTPPSIIPSFTTPAGNLGLVWRGLRIFIVQYPEQFTAALSARLPFDYVLLRQNVRVEPANLQEVFQFKSLILDSSNKPWYRQLINQKCRRQQIPIYDVSKQGAFVYSPTN
ncbi:ComEC/Rec2 family competence protein [Adhaeribacter pallidiroseus]|uniref:ComE operon protein n=1 Tax=Adhaeribacter pallidiroseus TaxID=2072847 RepID=A0A369QD07_9BACT|nr:ComEC/Rec2 family competence protein [Adhaeribacter pallidiroseus]RDC62220.1 ComE operon protein [Adhaeribacter pallidiroseus]